MSESTFSKILDFSDEVSLLSSRFKEVTGNELEFYVEPFEVIKYYMYKTTEGESFSKHSKCPLSEVMDNLRIPTDYREFIENDVEQNVYDKVLDDLEEFVITGITTQRPGFEIGFTYQGGCTMIFDILITGDYKCMKSSMNRDYLK